MYERSTSTLAMTMTINNVGLDNQQVDNDTEAVMKKSVLKSTREKY